MNKDIIKRHPLPWAYRRGSAAFFVWDANGRGIETKDLVISVPFSAYRSEKIAEEVAKSFVKFANKDKS